MFGGIEEQIMYATAYGGNSHNNNNHQFAASASTPKKAASTRASIESSKRRRRRRRRKSSDDAPSSPSLSSPREERAEEEEEEGEIKRRGKQQPPHPNNNAFVPKSQQKNQEKRGGREDAAKRYELTAKLWTNKQPHDHYLYQMYEKLDRDIERLVVSKDEERKERHVQYVTDWLTALAKVPVEDYLPAGLYLRDTRPVPEDVRTRVDLNAFYGDKLITSVLLDKIRKADGKYGANQAPRNKMEANNFLSACVRNKTFAALAPDILPDVKITAEEWKHHEHVAGTAVEAAIIAVADLSNDTLKQAERDVAIDAVANLILEEGMKFAKSDVKPARAKFNDLLSLYSVRLTSRSVTGLVHDPKFIATATVTQRRVYSGDQQRKKYKNMPLEFGTIEVEAEGTSSENAKEAASVQILDLLKKLGLVDEKYRAVYVADIEPVCDLWREHKKNEMKKDGEDEEGDVREKQRRKIGT